MTKRFVYTLLALCCLSLTVAAQTRRQKQASHKDFVYVSAAAGVQGLLNDQETLQNKLGSGLQLGVGYRMYHHHLLFEAGLEGKYGNWQVGAVDDHLTLPMVDSQGDDFTMNVYLNDRKDALHTAHFQVPVMVGGEWSHFYFLLGAKLDLNVYGSAITTARLTTRATYDRFAEDFTNMPNHQLYENQVLKSDRQQLAFNPQVLAIGEIGYRLGDVWSQTGYDVPQSKTRYYLALFAEYGILNLHKAGNAGDPVTMESTAESLTIQVSPAYNSSTYADAVVRNFMVGIKLTVAFEMPKGRQCVICREQKALGRNNFTW